MSENCKCEGCHTPTNWSLIGWGLVVVLLMAGVAITFIGQFFGAPWFLPWVFLVALFFACAELSKVNP